jgi:hypothetical protein
MALNGTDPRWYRMNFHLLTRKEMEALQDLDSLEDRRRREVTYGRLLEGMPVLDSKFSEAMQARKWEIAGFHDWLGVSSGAKSC